MLFFFANGDGVLPFDTDKEEEEEEDELLWLELPFIRAVVVTGSLSESLLSLSDVL